MTTCMISCFPLLMYSWFRAIHWLKKTCQRNFCSLSVKHEPISAKISRHVLEETLNKTVQKVLTSPNCTYNFHKQSLYWFYIACIHTALCVYVCYMLLINTLTLTLIFCCPDSKLSLLWWKRVPVSKGIYKPVIKVLSLLLLYCIWSLNVCCWLCRDWSSLHSHICSRCSWNVSTLTTQQCIASNWMTGQLLRVLHIIAPVLLPTCDVAFSASQTLTLIPLSS